MKGICKRQNEHSSKPNKRSSQRVRWSMMSICKWRSEILRMMGMRREPFGTVSGFPFIKYIVAKLEVRILARNAWNMLTHPISYRMSHSCTGGTFTWSAMIGLWARSAWTSTAVCWNATVSSRSYRAQSSSKGWHRAESGDISGCGYKGSCWSDADHDCLVDMIRFETVKNTTLADGIKLSLWKSNKKGMHAVSAFTSIGAERRSFQKGGLILLIWGNAF